MSYEKIGFNKGDVLKAEHLNHIEDMLLSLSPNPTKGLQMSDISENLEDLFLNPRDYYFYDMDMLTFGTLYFKEKNLQVS